MNRSREAIRRHLIRLGYIAEPVKRKTVEIKTRWFDTNLNELSMREVR